VDTGAYRTILSCWLKDQLSLGRGQWQTEDAERQLTLHAPVLFLPVSSSVLGQDVLRQLRATVGQSELALICEGTTFNFPLTSIPGNYHVLAISENMMPGYRDEDRQGGGHKGRGGATDYPVPIKPEEVERQRRRNSTQNRLQERFPYLSQEEITEMITVELVEVTNLDRVEKRKGSEDGKRARVGKKGRREPAAPKSDARYEDRKDVRIMSLVQENQVVESTRKEEVGSSKEE
jgi:hypothetical protein